MILLVLAMVSKLPEGRVVVAIRSPPALALGMVTKPALETVKMFVVVAMVNMELLGLVVVPTSNAPLEEAILNKLVLEA